MQIIYVFYNEWTQAQKVKLNSYGVNVEIGYNRLDVVESADTIPVLKVLDEWGIKKFIGTIYDEKDFEKSNLFVYVGVWPNGYPMPDNDNGYEKLTYNTDDLCFFCGIGKKQKSPFRLKKEPKWGRKTMFELNWIFDEIFVSSSTYVNLFKKYNIGCRDVLLYKKETVIQNTVQLDIPKISVPLDLRNQPFEICEQCQRKKYSPQVKGFFPSFAKDIPGHQMFKCSEYFGSGAEAHNKIFITRQLWEDIKMLNMKPNVMPVKR